MAQEFPVKLTHPLAKPGKVIHANNQTELAALLRLGWQIKPVDPK